MKKAYYAPLAEDFKRVRLTACLTQENVSEMLHVTLKTVKNWEKGHVAIPYSAFKLLKVLGHLEFADDDWQGWSLNQGKLWSPSGRSFLPYELLYIGNYFAMARLWIAERETIRKHRKHIQSEPKLRVIQGGRA
jgi:transcriptional regulator with XRE-family HTH domain